MKHIFNDIRIIVKNKNLKIINENSNKPWGGYFVVSNNSKKKFINIFFKNLDHNKFFISKNLSFKILVVYPKKRLSWQYHNRRSELLKVIKGSVYISKSFDDKEGEKILYKEGEIITINKRERHRIIGSDVYSLIAEVWMHSDDSNLSNEDDIFRIHDDFDRI